MKLSLRQKLFLSIFGATAMALLSVFFFVYWSINYGFFEYLNQIEQSRLEQLGMRLSTLYAQSKSWQFLKDSPEMFYQLLENINNNQPSLQFPPRPHLPFPPFVVLDMDKNPVVGDSSDIKNLKCKPIFYEQEIIGYIGIRSPKHFLSPPQIDFLKKQKTALLIIVASVLLFVGIFSISISKYLIYPLKEMAKATNKITAGNYSARVSVSSADEIGKLAKNFNEMALALEKNEKARRQWIADISHEIRTPVTILRGEVEAIIDGIRPLNLETINSIHNEILRLNRLVEDLYQLAISDIGTLNYHKEKIDLKNLLIKSVQTYFQEFNKKNIKIRIEVAQEPVNIYADKERMQQLLSNLFDNSLKYTNSGGQLIIRLVSDKKQTTIEFEDSEPGIREEELNKIFERFYRVETSRSRKTGGSGLGLAICKNIVEAHGGTISAFPSSIGGVLIKIILPQNEL